MVFNCPVVRCIANYDCYDRGAVFSLPEKEEQKKQLDLVFKPNGYFIHKESQYLLQTLCRQSSEEGLKRTKLLYEYKPVPTIIPVTREKENLPQMQFLKLLKLRKSHQDKRFFKKTR